MSRAVYEFLLRWSSAVLLFWFVHHKQYEGAAAFAIFAIIRVVQDAADRIAEEFSKQGVEKLSKEEK